MGLLEDEASSGFPRCMRGYAQRHHGLHLVKHSNIEDFYYSCSEYQRNDHHNARYLSEIAEAKWQECHHCLSREQNEDRLITLIM